MKFRKKLLFIIVSILLLILPGAYYFFTKLTARPFFPPTSSRQILFELSASPENIKKDVMSLTTIIPARNHENIESLNKAEQYVEEEFKKYCPKVKRQTFIVNKKEYANIICLFGEEKNLIVIGAHYDVDHESIGADDNASGVAGILEIARLLKKAPGKNNIELVAYTLEELPYFRTENMGSYKHAKYLKDNNIQVKYMLSLEMIGYFSDEAGSQKFPSPALRLIYPNKGNFISIIGRLHKDEFITNMSEYLKKIISVPVHPLNAPESLLNANSSDQLNYWSFDFPAAMVTDTGPYRNPNYHKVTDTPETLDYNKSADVVTGIYQYILN